MKRLLTILSGVLLIISSLSSCVSNPENDEKIDEVIDKEEE